MTQKCIMCSRQFITYYSKPRVCCSIECRKKRFPKIIKKCKVCKKSFIIPQYRVGIITCCSQKCKGINHSRKMIGHKPFHWKGGKIKNNGYVYILKKDHPFSDRDGYILEHRFVMEQSIRRYLNRSEVIHHRNKIKNDNRIENLELINSQSEHMKKHYPKGKNFVQVKNS